MFLLTTHPDLSGDLPAELRSWSEATLPLDTQDIEGANSIIKKIKDIAPNIQISLLSDRLLVKKGLTSQILGVSPHERSQARMNAISFAVETHGHARRVLSEVKHRFPDPLPLESDPIPPIADAAADATSPSLVAIPDAPPPPDALALVSRGARGRGRGRPKGRAKAKARVSVVKLSAAARRLSSF